MHDKKIAAEKRIKIVRTAVLSTWSMTSIGVMTIIVAIEVVRIRLSIFRYFLPTKTCIRGPEDWWIGSIGGFSIALVECSTQSEACEIMVHLVSDNHTFRAKLVRSQKTQSSSRCLTSLIMSSAVPFKFSRSSSWSRYAVSCRARLRVPVTQLRKF